MSETIIAALIDGGFGLIGAAVGAFGAFKLGTSKRKQKALDNSRRHVAGLRGAELFYLRHLANLSGKTEKSWKVQVYGECRNMGWENPADSPTRGGLGLPNELPAKPATEKAA